MKIVVAIKQILDPSGFTVNRKRERIFVNREEYIINPPDLNALELVLRLKDENEDVEVIGLGLGPPRVDDALREAIARGADRGVLISDPALADLKPDAAGAARLLGAAVERIGSVSLIVCGTFALDSVAGELPGRLAEVLGWPMLSAIATVDQVAHGRLRASQPSLQLEADMPALLTVLRDANQPRHIYGARAMNAYAEDRVVSWGLADLAFDPDQVQPFTYVSGRRFPPERSPGTRLEGPLDETVKRLVVQLRAQELI
jgi:electron transfer flavoprotein beta subunit